MSVCADCLAVDQAQMALELHHLAEILEAVPQGLEQNSGPQVPPGGKTVTPPSQAAEKAWPSCS
jgi:hypothetical protein